MDDANDKPEQIQRQIDATKASLVEKLGALETHVADSVQATTDSVSETVNSVKETVESITDSVKETVENVSESVQHVGEFLNIKRQAQQRPWAVVGVAVVTGCVAAYLLSGKRNPKTSRREERSPQGVESYSAPTAPPIYAAAATKPKEEKKSGWFWDSLGSLSGLAIGSMMGIVRDMAVKELPGVLGKNVSEEMDRITSHLGGKPMAGSLFNSDKSSAV